MATTYVGKNAPIRGPYLKHAFAKYVLKGEDAWLQQRDVTTASPLGKGMHRASLAREQMRLKTARLQDLEAK